MKSFWLYPASRYIHYRVFRSPKFNAAPFLVVSILLIKGSYLQIGNIYYFKGRVCVNMTHNDYFKLLCGCPSRHITYFLIKVSSYWVATIIPYNLILNLRLLLVIFPYVITLFTILDYVKWRYEYVRVIANITSRNSNVVK